MMFAVREADTKPEHPKAKQKPGHNLFVFAVVSNGHLTKKQLNF